MTVPQELVVSSRSTGGPCCPLGQGRGLSTNAPEGGLLWGVQHHPDHGEPEEVRCDAGDLAEPRTSTLLSCGQEPVSSGPP